MRLGHDQDISGIQEDAGHVDRTRLSQNRELALIGLKDLLLDEISDFLHRSRPLQSSGGAARCGTITSINIADSMYPGHNNMAVGGADIDVIFFIFRE